MALQFVLGNSGSGKSEYIYRNIVSEARKNPGKNYLIIVPEQFTLQTQRKLVDLSLNGAIMNIDILSFKRLAYRIFDELGIRDISVLEETGKNLVLRKLAQEKESELTVLRPNMGRMGYISELKSLLSEFVQYNISSEQLKKYVNEKSLSPVLSAKLSDVATIYESFENYMRDRYITAEELLQVLCKVIDQSNIIKNCEVIFDEFTGFTPMQNHLLEKLFLLVDKVWVSFVMDAEEDFYHSIGFEELFYLPKKNIKHLLRMAEELKVEVLKPIVLAHSHEKRFVHASPLAFLEQNLFRSKVKHWEGKVEEIKLTSLRTPKDELTYTARTINELVQRGGYRYKDIAVVSGNVDLYANYMETVFGKYHIPYYVDTTKKIVFHPFVEWIRALLEVIQKDYSYDSVFRFLRCGFSRLEDCEIDELENYILATGIRGRNVWKRKWNRLPRGGKEERIEILNDMRAYIADMLDPIAEIFVREDSNVRESVCAIYKLICEMGIEKQLLEKEKIYLSKGDQVKAKEYGQIYRIVMDLFDKFVYVLGAEWLSIREFIEILDAGLEAAEVATIPPGYDSIIMGDIERTRLNRIKILFFVGVNDGLIPKNVSSGGIISQYEREILQQLDIELAPGIREQTFIQRFYLYLNLTKPSDALYITFSRTDTEGKIIRPSYLVSTIRRMFPQMGITEIEEIKKKLNYSTQRAAMDYIVHGEKNEVWFSLAKWFKTMDEEWFENMMNACYIRYVDEPISKAVAQAIYGTKIEGSVTRLEQFARCAYAHFLKYGLLLRERLSSGFEHVDIGNIYHDALQRYSMKLANSKTDWFHISDEERKRLSDLAFEEAIEGYTEIKSYATAENMHMIQRMKHIFEQTVWALTMQVRKGEFVPEVFEVSFSDVKDIDAMQFEFEHKERLELTGRIDRVDICDDNGRIYVKIIDYKSGSTKFDLLKLYQGTQLQLVVYMSAAMELQGNEHQKKTVIPGGMLYYHIDDPILEVANGVSPEQLQQMILEQLKPDGLVNEEETIYRAMDKEFEFKSDVIPVVLKKNGDLSSISHVASTEEFEIIKEYVQNQIRRIGGEIFQGKITIDPIESSPLDSSCGYCPYSNVCGIHSKIPGLVKNHGRKCDRSDVIEKMKLENAKHKGENR